MKKMFVSLAKLSLVALVTVMLCPINSARADGKAIFLANKCNKCHEGAGIAKLPSEGEEDGAATENKNPKLDGIGASMIKNWGSADAVKAKMPSYWAKEIPNPATKESHKKKYTCGSDCGALIDWMLKL